MLECLIEKKSILVQTRDDSPGKTEKRETDDGKFAVARMID